MIIVRYGEIALKGKNRKFFEDKLIENIKEVIDPELFSSIKLRNSRILIESDHDKEYFRDKLSKVFGIYSYSFAHKTELNIDKIKEKASETIDSGTFKVDTQRANKKFRLKSPEINGLVGEHIINNNNLKVDIHNPDKTIFIEILDGFALIHNNKTRGLGGMPVGTNGSGVLLISGGIDSPVAGFLSMKRGVKVIALHMQTGESIDKVKKLVKKLKEYQPDIELYNYPYYKIHEHIKEKSKPQLRCLLCKRMMILLAKELAIEKNARAIIMGDNIGQVASQTLDNMSSIQTGINYLVLRPLLSFDKQEIIEIGQNIGTFNISVSDSGICPIVPLRPATKSTPEIIDDEIDKIDLKSNTKALPFSYIDNL